MYDPSVVKMSPRGAEPPFHALVRRILASVEALRRAAEGGERPAPATLEALERDFEDLILAAGRLDEMRGRNLEAIRAQEEERARIAREIHDGPAQLFAGLVRGVEYAEALLARGAPSEAVRRELEGLKAEVRKGLVELRRFIFHLRPPALADLGLAAAIRQVADEAGRTSGLEITLRLDGLEGRRDLPPEAEVALFRITQEAIQNAVKHAEARRVEVRILRDAEGLTLEVEDDGRGIGEVLSTTALLERRKLGLIGMRERAEMVGGRLGFFSPPGGGTLVRATIFHGGLTNADGGATKDAGGDAGDG